MSGRDATGIIRAMRNPTRWRNLGIALVAAGGVAMPLAFLLPSAIAEPWLGGVLLGGGMMAMIFGGLWTAWRHQEARAESALLRGDGVIARWRVDPRTWSHFVALNRTVSVNVMPVREAAPAAGVDVIVGASAIVVDGVVRTLCHSAMVDGHLRAWGGDWIIERAGALEGPPRCIALYARMRNSGSAGVFGNIVFPLSAAAPHEGATALDHLSRRAADRAALVAAQAQRS